MQKNKRPLPGLQLYLNNISFQNFTRKGPWPFSQLCVSMVAKCRWRSVFSLATGKVSDGRSHTQSTSRSQSTKGNYSLQLRTTLLKKEICYVQKEGKTSTDTVTFRLRARHKGFKKKTRQLRTWWAKVFSNCKWVLQVCQNPPCWECWLWEYIGEEMSYRGTQNRWKSGNIGTSSLLHWKKLFIFRI